MATPSITLTPADPVIEEELSPNAAAGYLLTSRANVTKLRAAGYLADLTVESLKPVRTADLVTAGGKLPLIQTAPAERSTDGWRTWWGDAPHLSNSDWLNAQRGDWTGAGAARIVDAGYLLVGIGGLITGVTKVVKAVPSGDPRKSRFELELLGRLTGEVRSLEKDFPETASDEDQLFAHSLVGKRYEPRAGGSIMWL
ncbi:hypothetical protein [Pseudarthrobacter sp. BIM B-2242]|uniref:hypothetical protein n=1 Tax=Pseudarthrobacter sp. BIM B-2242 TaxID=2772401 RepID=UPI00168AB2A1|nr:hypothetical protein [Pseudarthrobacter sp. BIM B-2242]QOD05873.1 hypothetical protein IDT60_23065 [Pseudarthrobacter sp. BIM B-2242]